MTRMKRFGLFITLLLCVCDFTTAADNAEDILVRLKASPESPWIGQKVVLHFDVLAKDGWAQVKSFRKIETDGGYLRRYESQGTRLNEKIDGVAYAGQRYELLFFGLRSGEVHLDPLPVGVEVKRWGTQTETDTIQVATPPLILRVRKPKGATSETALISSGRFKAEQIWEPETDHCKVGDAVTRVITREGADVAAMAFTPLGRQDVQGIGVYEKEPVLDDAYNRGELVGKRTEKTTYVMEQGGNYTLPQVEFFWWNLQKEQLEKITLPGLTIEVEGKSGAVAMHPVATGGNSLVLLAVGLASAGIFAVFMRQRERLLSFFRQWRCRRQQSEKAYFVAITKAAGAGDRREFIQAAMQWLDRLPGIDNPARLDLFLHTYGATSRYDSVILTDKSTWSPNSLYLELRKARKTYLQTRRKVHTAEMVLPPVGIQSPAGKQRATN